MVPVDMDEVVAEIVIVAVEVAAVTDASPAVDMVATIMLLTPIILLLVLLHPLKNIVLPDGMVLVPPTLHHSPHRWWHST